MFCRTATRALTNALKSNQVKPSINGSSFIHSLGSVSSQSRTLSTTQTRGKEKRFTNPKLRTHAVSFTDGDYSDYDYDNVHVEAAFADDEEWDLAPRDDPMDEEIKLRRRQEQEALKFQEADDEKRQKWIENAKPPVRKQEIDERGRSYGRGGRKTSTARVWIQPGEGFLTVNRRDFLDFFPREMDREMILSPFVATQTCGKFDVTVSVEGGGVTGKAGAVRHGIARALEKYNPDYRPPMKRLGFMTRDAREVERKKIGLKKARKAPQWVRR